MSRFFKVFSRALLASLLAVVWFAPAASAETVCEVTDDGWDCNIVVETFNQGPQFTFTLTEETEVTVRTFTSLTCDDWESGEGTDLYAADPVLSLFNDQGALLFSDDDSAEHNNDETFCWDALLDVTLPAGSYVLQADAYNEATTGVYSLEIFGGEWTVPQSVPEATPTPEPTPTPVPTSEPEPTPEPTPTSTPEPTPSPTPEPTPVPTSQPDPTPEEVSEATPEEPELPEVPELPEELPTPEELPPVEVYEPPVEEEWQPPPLILELEEEEEYPYDDGIIFEDIDWEDYDFNDLPEVNLDTEFEFEEEPFDLEEFEEFDEGQEELLVEEEIFDFDEELVDEPISEEDEAETEEEVTFVDEGEQEEPFVLEPDVGLEEQDFEELEVEDLDDETIAEILQDEDAAEEFFEEVIEDNPDFFEESSEEELEEVFEAAPELFNEMPDEIKEEFEEETNIFAGGFEDYQAEDSTITVQERRVVVTATTISAVAAARPTVRVSPSPSVGGPSVSQGGRKRR